MRQVRRDRVASGFTLGELVATIVIAGMLAGLALAGFGEIGDRARSRSTLQEAQALSREARGLAGLDGRSTLLAIDFTDNDLDRYQVGTQLAASTEGLILDPVYTGKAMAGLIAHIRAGRIGAGQTVVFLHTGGMPALFAYAEDVMA